MKDCLQWYAVYTRSCQEKKVAAWFHTQEIEHYCPLQKVERRWSDRKKIIMEPLFKSYVFVRIPAKQQAVIKMVDGIVNFVHYLGKPAVIPDEEIDTVKQFMNEYKNIKLEKMDILINDKVKITGGPFMNKEGNVWQVNNKTVKVLLPSLGFTMIAEVDKTCITK
jgi:transcription antitermination factor NusG